MLKRRKFLLILALVLVVALSFSLYLMIFRRGEKIEAALTELRMADLPAKVAKEAGLTLTVTAYEGESVMTNYVGTIHFTSTDPSVAMPSDYTFVLGDQGTKIFTLGLYFGSTGIYQIKVEDLAAVISDTQAGIVVFDGHANGSLVKTSDSPAVYYLQNGRKSVISSPSVFSSRFKWNQIIIISNSEMSNYEDDSLEPTLHYREGTLFKSSILATVYVVENKQKRPIDSASTFEGKGYSWANIIIAENESIVDLHTTGSNLTSGSTLPNSSLIKVVSSAAVYYLEGSNRRVISSPTIFESQFKWPEIIVVSDEVLASFPVGSPLLYRSGSIIKDHSTAAVYFIEEDKKRIFSSGMFYLGLGFSWSAITTSESDYILDLHQTGRTMYLLPKYIDIIGDTRNGHTVHQTLTNLITNDKPYLVFNVGDLVNTGSSASDWATFDSIISNLRANTRYYPAIGNHEIASSYFEARFGTDKWYSMDVDNIHYIILDTEESLASGSAQYNWLHTDLDNQPLITRFTLVFFHRPPCSLGGLTDAVSLFETHGVDLVFNGHSHLYARMVSSGIYYVISGGGGASLSGCPVCSYSTCNSTYEYVRLLLNNNQLELRAYNSSGTQIDTVDIPGV